jgi:protoporphyrinogen/coproporphyrinogen III oxidase
MKKVAVVGAGISGLACAYNLQKAGFDVTVFEKETQVGGRMRSREKDGLMFDIGANHLIPLYTHMRSYFDEFNIDWQRMSDAKYGLYHGGRTQSPYSALSKSNQLRMVAMSKMKRTMTTDEFFNLTLVADLDVEDAYEFVMNKVGQYAADTLGDGFCSGYEFHGLKELSSACALGLVDSITHENADWALHRTGKGMSALSDGFAQGLDVKLGEGVESVEISQAPTATLLLVRSSDNGATPLEFDLVVMASPAPVTRRILNNPTDAQLKVLEGTEFAASIVVAYRIDIEGLSDKTLVWTPEIESFAIASYSLEHTKGEECMQDGKTLLIVFLHDEYARSVFNLSDKEIFELVKEEWLKLADWWEGGELESFDLERWENAMPKFKHGYLGLVKEFLENGQGDNNVWFCGDWLNSPWTEGALRCGERVAEAIVERYF